MNYAQIKDLDLANGLGVRVSIFCCGCEFHCPDCFNSEAWDFKAGKPFTEETLKTLLQAIDKPYIKGLSILGGEPLHPNNINQVIDICKKVKEKLPEKDIWIWTGYLYENIVDKNILNYADIIIDGLFDKTLRDVTLEFRGSSNQRIIDVKKSIENKDIILWEQN